MLVLHFLVLSKGISIHLAPYLPSGFGTVLTSNRVLDRKHRRVLEYLNRHSLPSLVKTISKIGINHMRISGQLLQNFA